MTDSMTSLSLVYNDSTVAERVGGGGAISNTRRNCAGCVDLPSTKLGSMKYMESVLGCVLNIQSNDTWHFHVPLELLRVLLVIPNRFRLSSIFGRVFLDSDVFFVVVEERFLFRRWNSSIIIKIQKTQWNFWWIDDFRIDSSEASLSFRLGWWKELN